jgi:hypothetical protein
MPEKNMEEFKEGLDQFIHDLTVIRKEDDYKYNREQLIMMLKALKPDATVGRINKDGLIERVNTLLRERNLKRSEKGEITINQMLDFLVTSARPRDGYVNGVQMCKAGKKNIEEWYSLESTKELIRSVCKTDFVEESKVIQGELIHPHLGIKLAIWISDVFSKEVDKWIDKLVSTNSVRIFPDSRNEIIDGLLHLIFLEDYYETDDEEEVKSVEIKNIFKEGSCLYIISDTSDKKLKYKVGFTDNINMRLYEEKRTTPKFKLEFLIYSDNSDFIKQGMYLRLIDNIKVFKGSEWIYKIDLKYILEGVESLIHFACIHFTKEPNISKYN